MPTPWQLTPLKPAYQSVFSPLGGAAAPTQQATPYASSSYQIAPITPAAGTTYRSTGSTLAPQPAPTASRSSAIATLGNINGSGVGQPTSTRSPYGQPTQPVQQAPAGPSAGVTSPQRSGALSTPGAYENWYQQNAGQYSKPTTLSSYYQSVAGKLGGQRYQPTNAQQAFNAAGSLAQPSYGVTNAQGVSGQLRQSTAGEGYMRNAAGMVGGVNNTAQYYGDNRNFFESPGQIEDYYANNGQQFQQAGFGENNAQNILQSNEMQGLYDNRIVGDEFGYFQQPLRDKSYSEQLYESGNTGLNQWYDLQSKRQTEDLQNQMAAMGVFGSGETVEGMARIREGLGAEQARDMAGLAGQADDQRLGRAGLAMDFSGAAANEELGRGGLMLEGANTGLQLDRDAISRLYQGGQLANQASQYGLDRTVAGGSLARSADDSLANQASTLGGIGRDMSSTEIDRLMGSGNLGLQGDAEQRARLESYFGMGRDTNRLGLDAQAAELDWINSGGQLAGNVDRGNLDWLNAGGGAAQTAQNMFQERERYGFTDPFAAAQGMAGSFQSGSQANSAAEAADRTEAVNLLMQQSGMDAVTAERRASEWMALGTLGVQLAALRAQPRGGG